MEITSRVIKEFQSLTGLSDKEVSLSEHLSLNFDSLDHVEFIMSIEEEFEISIDDDTASNFTTLQEVIDYLIENT